MIESIVGLIVGFVAGWLVGNHNGRRKVEADIAAAKAKADQLLAGAPTIRTAGGGGGPIEPPRN